MIPVFTANKCWPVSYKVCLCFIVLSVTVCTIGYLCTSFAGIKSSCILLVIINEEDVYVSYIL